MNRRDFIKKVLRIIPALFVGSQDIELLPKFDNMIIPLAKDYEIVELKTTASDWHTYVMEAHYKDNITGQWIKIDTSHSINS